MRKRGWIEFYHMGMLAGKPLRSLFHILLSGSALHCMLFLFLGASFHMNDHDFAIGVFENETEWVIFTTTPDWISFPLASDWPFII